ncbi:MAG: tripartite tricarboxylate transporter substrate binding protein [Burkholderiales bacterium]
MLIRSRRLRTRRRFRHALLALAAACLGGVAGEGAAQTYPTRPVRFIVAYPPGGGADTMARVVAQKLAESWGQQVVIDNRPGGNTNIAADLAAHAAPDGYTLLELALTHTVNASLYSKLPYEVRRDFAHAVLLASVPGILTVHPSIPAKTTREFIDIAKAKPGQLNYASTGSGGPQHLGMELFKTLTGVDITHIPYKGAAPALSDVLSGQVHSIFGNMISTLPHTRAGRLRGLAVSSAKRSQAAPELPTVAESGVPGFESGSWWGISLPAGTPRPIVAKINADVNRIIASPELRTRLAGEGTEMLGGTPEEFAAYVRSEIEKWAKVVKFAKMRVE